MSYQVVAAKACAGLLFSEITTRDIEDQLRNFVHGEYAIYRVLHYPERGWVSHAAFLLISPHQQLNINYTASPYYYNIIAE